MEVIRKKKEDQPSNTNVRAHVVQSYSNRNCHAWIEQYRNPGEQYIQLLKTGVKSALEVPKAFVERP